MSRPPRIPGHQYLGEQRYSLTICTNQRREHLTEDATARMVIDQFLRLAVAHDIDLIAYCVMTDHMHALAAGRHEGAALEPFVKLAKQKTGYAFKQLHGTPLWQPGYYDRVIRNEEATADVVRYIIENPLRKGLVADVRDYPYWGSSLYTREEVLATVAARRV